MTDLGVQRESIKSHGTDEVNMSSLGIHYLLVTRYPQTCVLGQHFHHLQQGVRILWSHYLLTLKVLRL